MDLPILDLEGVVVIDFMAQVRAIKMKSKNDSSTDKANSSFTFGDLINNFFNSFFYSNRRAGGFHIIFDSYLAVSIKGSEREKRGARGSIRLAEIGDQTPIPVQIEKFWSCSQNKVILQEFAKEKLLKLACDHSVRIVVSGTVSDEEAPTPGQAFSPETGVTSLIPDLSSHLEEADHRIILHIEWELKQTANTSRPEICVETNDTDVVVLLLYYFQVYSEKGLRRLWVKHGRGDKTCFLPLHTIHGQLGENESKCMLKTHIGTGCDYLSKVGTKRSALAANPVVTLPTFGDSLTLRECEIDEAEAYLVRVYSSAPKTVTDKTFDALRYEMYKKNMSVLQLPPTSYSVRNGHIPRWWYIFKTQSHLLDSVYGEQLKPENWGWVIENDELLPVKALNLVPDKLAETCKNCSSGCSTKRCCCKRNGFPCNEFCGCKNCTNN